MPVRGGNGARFQRKRAADHASCLLDEVARGIHGSFTGESGRGARFSAIGRSFTGKVALGRCEGSTSPPPWQALGPSAGGRMRAFPAGFDDSDAVRASGGRSWPSQSEAGAARTRFPRRPHNGWRHRASPWPHNGWRHRASALRRLPKGGIVHPLVRAGEIVSGGTLLAEIVSPMTGEVMEEISAPVGGVVFFTCNKLMVTEHALLFRIVPRGLANA